MSHRSFEDRAGRRWEVWDVYPERVRVWLDADRKRDTEEGPRLINASPYLQVPADMQRGWLAFQSEGECRRLSPIPATWPVLPDDVLAELLDRSLRTRSRDGTDPESSRNCRPDVTRARQAGA